MVQQQLPSNVPQMLLFTGPARARGHRLDGYGVFFDVEVPALSQSVMWSFQTLERDLGLNQALQVIRDAAEQVTDRSTKINLQQAVQRIELQMAPAASYPAGEAAPPPAAAAANAGTARPVSDRPAAPAPQMRVLADQAPRLSPDALYESEVKTALIEAMLNNTASIVLAPDEWLTVAARDSGDRLSANEIYDFVTIQLRIRGSDLAAFRADRLSEDDAKKRVEVRVF
jgi:hypothetical protein